MGLRIPFRLRGLDGEVHVSVRRNEDPERWGWDLLGIDVPLELIRGFPVVEATVEFAGEGYAAVMGWVQVVRYEASDEPEPVAMVDVAPQLRETGFPYVTFGVRPVYFDAPAISATDAIWRARTFLASSPDALMTRVIEPVCGFHWGYDVRGGTPELTQVARAEAEDWLISLSHLRDHYPDWEWRTEYASTG